MKVSMLGVLVVGSAVAEKDSRLLGDKSDYFYHDHDDVSNKFWVFGSTGLHVFSTDGRTEVKRIDATDICKDGECSFKEAVSDGHKYVFATNYEEQGDGYSHVEVFSVLTGVHLASLRTCKGSYHLDTAPHREELWVHCWIMDDNDEFEGHIDVFSTNVLAIDHSEVDLNLSPPPPSPPSSPGVEPSPSPEPSPAQDGFTFPGLAILDASIPNEAFATSLSTPYFYKIDVHERKVVEYIPLPKGCKGSYKASMSPINKHAYVRCTVCCSCGKLKDTMRDCPVDSKGNDVAGKWGKRATMVDVFNVITGERTQGPIKGFCGEECYGSKADPGIIEIDLLKGEVVGFHQPTSSNGRHFGGEPVTSPTGDVIVLKGTDGTYADLLRPSGNGQKSTLITTLELGFSLGDAHGVGTSDVAFIQDGTRNMAIFTSTKDDFIKVVDMSTLDRNFAASTTVSLLEDEQVDNYYGSSATHYRYGVRKVDCALDSPYCMVNSDAKNRLHVINVGSSGNVADAKVEYVINNVPSNYILYVRNYLAPNEGIDASDSMKLAAKAVDAAHNSADAARMSAASANITATAVRQVVAAMTQTSPPPPADSGVTSASPTDSGISPATTAALVMSSVALFASALTMILHTCLWRKAQAVVHFRTSGVKTKREIPAMNSL